MATSLPIGGKVVLTPQSPAAAPITLANTDIVFGTAVFRITGTDVFTTLEDGSIVSHRQSVGYEVSFQTSGDDSNAMTDDTVKCNTKVECYEDDATTPVGTTFYGALKVTFNESDETSSWTITGDATAVPA